MRSLQLLSNGLIPVFLAVLLLCTACDSRPDKRPGLNATVPEQNLSLHSDQNTVSIELSVDTSADFDELEWDVIYSPEGSMVGVADYDGRARLTVNTRGLYVVEVSGIRQSAGVLARDTTTVRIR